MTNETQVHARITASLEHLTTVAAQVLGSAADHLITRTDAAAILQDRYAETAHWLALYEAHLPLAAAHDRRITVLTWPDPAR